MELRRLGGRVIEAYGEGRFRIAGQVFTGSILIGREEISPWPVESLAGQPSETLFDSLTPLITGPSHAAILLVGCGKNAALLPAVLRIRLRDLGIAAEAMDTGAACRTYNVLVAEDRSVAAALIAV